MFALFERLLKPTATPTHPEPPPGLIAFYWHYACQAKGLFACLFGAGFAVALLDALIPAFIGRIVTLITGSPPESLFATFWPILLTMAGVLLVLRPAALTLQNIVANQAIAANVANLIRWQSHWHVVRQSWSFFQNDFAGRIANRVMQTGPAIRESLVALLTAVWYILVHQRAGVAGGRRPLAGVADHAGLSAISCCCVFSCRACATAPRRCRKSVRW
jgi:ATP-binding cassette, subfamily B, multidrug efflux pump